MGGGPEELARLPGWLWPLCLGEGVQGEKMGADSWWWGGIGSACGEKVRTQLKGSRTGPWMPGLPLSFPKAQMITEESLLSLPNPTSKAFPT